MRHVSPGLAVRASRLCQVLIRFGIVMAAACSSSSTGRSTNAGDGGKDTSAQDGTTIDARTCKGTAVQCVRGTSGGQCGDVFTVAECVGGTWTCPTGTIAESLCGCFSAAPWCYPGTAGSACGSQSAAPTCSGGRWNCPDGTVPSQQCTGALPDAGGTAGDGGGDTSAPDGATIDAGGCSGSTSLCFGGTAGGQCGDSATNAQCVGRQWKCPIGTIAESLCGCFNSAPICSPGAAGGACGSETVTPICGGGQWNCPDGTVPSDQCACVLSGDAGTAGDGGCL